MVKDIKKEESRLFQCEECGFEYRDKEWAEKCEAWCREHKSCNLEIIQYGEPGQLAQPPKTPDVQPTNSPAA